MKLKVLSNMWTVLTVAGLGLLLACPDKQEAAPKLRAELHKLTGNTVELWPSAGQNPYCLVYTLSQKGVVRQLTLTRKNESIPCQAGKPIGNVAYRIPTEEGAVRIFVLFSDTPLKAGSIAQQIFEQNAQSPHFTAMDLRLPGRVDTQMLDFTPSLEAPAQEGGVITRNGEINGPQENVSDAGTP